MLDKLKKIWSEFPPLLRKFCIKALVLILIWKISYHLYLKPHRIIDQPLTNVVTSSSVSFLQLFYPNDIISWEGKKNLADNIAMYGTTIYLNGKKSLGIADACNALELMILYVGFILCLPASPKRMATFIVLGLVGIFILNIFRCAGMFWFNLNKKEWFDFAHHYAFKIVAYAAIFGTWVLYARKLNIENEK